MAVAVAAEPGLRGARAPALAPDERVPPTPEEARRLALAITEANPDLAALIFVDATTGMRRGEICGLRFCDIDLATGQATIWWRCSDLPKSEVAGLDARANVLKVYPERGRHALGHARTRSGAASPWTPSPSPSSPTRRLGLRFAARRSVSSSPKRPSSGPRQPTTSEPWRPDRVSGAFTALRNREHLPHVML